MRATSLAFKSAAATLAVILGLTSSANALSCMRPDLAQTMETAKASDDLYYILVGSFTSPPRPKTPKTGQMGKQFHDAKPYSVQATFNGRVLSNQVRYDSVVTHLPVDIAVGCAGPWCGAAPNNGQEVIAFVKSRPGQPLLLEVGACPDKVHMFERAKIKKLRSCFEQSCESEVNPRFDRR